MEALQRDENVPFEEAVRGLLAGDFSRLEPLFDARSADTTACPIVEWHRQGRFTDRPHALAEAFTCACFVGREAVVEYLLQHGVTPSGGSSTGLDAFHWAVNRGQIDVVKLLIERKASLETRNMYGGTVLGIAVWSAIHEPRPKHLLIIAALLEAGAKIDETIYPCGDARVDELLIRYIARG